MLAILSSTGRVLWRHWPALLAWYLAGVLVQYGIVELSGWIGARSATIGLLILPIGILARLIAFVAMFLVLRDGLRSLQAIAPLPESAAARRNTLLTALLASILPFFAVYLGQGMLRDDVAAYTARALEVRDILRKTGVELAETDNATNVGLTIWTGVIIVIAFSARWAWSRWSAKLPRSLAVLAVYFEVVWVFFSALVVSDLVDGVNSWIDHRAAMVWLGDARAWLGEHVLALVWVSDAIGWLLAQAGPILLAPLVWLTIAGVIYGQAIVAEKLQVEHRLLTRLRRQAARVPNPVMRRLQDLGDELSSRFKPIGRALLLMWRAGPVIISSYALMYVAVLALQSYLRFWVTRLVGPHDLLSFWMVFDTAILLIPVLIIEPLRVALAAGAYDTTLGMLRRAQPSALGSAQGDAEAAAAAAGVLPEDITPAAEAMAVAGAELDDEQEAGEATSRSGTA
ncbi:MULTISPECIES: hypothetical protein [unclassified Microbacterium]|uniref:hypothetical protein n=1 Tax=unclassified Microbacterium TaxID=2609290 RepID=UPI0012FB499F|nr:hypothetical protein [Microbacterium sp. MAH-37]MVQ43499.1 hypothetical protein [Microbacterium sp. MAH-37]